MQFSARCIQLPLVKWCSNVVGWPGQRVRHLIFWYKFLRQLPSKVVLKDAFAYNHVSEHNICTFSGKGTAPQIPTTRASFMLGKVLRQFVAATAAFALPIFAMWINTTQWRPIVPVE